MSSDRESFLIITLQSLMAQSCRDGWVSTRQFSDVMDCSIYSARARLLALQNTGRVLCRQYGKGRHNTLYWKVMI